MGRSVRTAALAALSAILFAWLAAAPAFAAGDGKPDTAHLQKAAEAFDAGVTAYKAHDFEGAASHFEAADAAVPSAKTLRQAIRARAEAGQGARAATLAALAIVRYPGDDATEKVALDTIDKVAPLVEKVGVSCASPCTIAVGALRVPGEPSTRWTVYLDPGSAALRATFASGATSAPEALEATAGGSATLRFEEKKKAPPPAPVPVPVPAPSADKGELPPPDAPPDEPKPDSRGISPWFFGVLAATTVGLGAATIWSGVDTLNNPGQAAVKAGCVGQGTSCPLYQEGLAHQERTNILGGVTAGAAVATAIVGVFTRWRGPKKEPPAAGLSPAALVLDRGALVGVAGAF